MIENESRLGKKELIALNMLQVKKLIIIMVAYAVIMGSMLLTGAFDDDPSMKLFIILLTIFIPLSMALGAFMNIRKLYKSDRVVQNVMITHFLFGEDALEIETKQGLTESRDKFPYANLHKATETKEYVFLFKNAMMAYVVDKAGFIQGNADQLKDMLRSKGVKLPKKR
jgi:hypothetical protein